MNAERTKIALTIAGNDSSGGAGIAADLKTFSALGVYGAPVITALTAQNTRGVRAIEVASPAFFAASLDAVLADLKIDAAKTGMLARADIVRMVAERFRKWPHIALVVDPVLVSTSGKALLEPSAIETLKAELFPLAALVTPNLAEAAVLLGAPEATSEADMGAQAMALAALGAKAALVKGGHGSGPEAVDILFADGKITRFASARIETPHTHGAGCTLSAAITAHLALGARLGSAVMLAKQFVAEALVSGLTLGVGQGRGPLDHLFAIRVRS